MSEVDFLAKQLEYCLTVGYLEPAKALVTELIAHRANIRFEFTMNYKCVTHDSYFKRDFSVSDLKKVVIYKKCCHVVCNSCLEHYIKSIFYKFGLQYNYVCPGCSVLGFNKPSKLSKSPDSVECFNRIIPQETQQLWREQNDIMTMTIRHYTTQEIQKSICYFFNNDESRIDCSGVAQTVTMPSCRHKVCTDCIEKSLSLCSDQPPFKCFVPTCGINLQDLFIKSLLIPKSQNMIRILRNLRIEGRSTFACPNCHHPIDTESHVIKIECPQCHKDLCAGCGKYNHGDIPCKVAEIGDRNYMCIQCSDSDPIPEYRNYYYQACALFEWDLEPKKKAALMTQYKIQFKIKKVFKIVNPKLQQLYDKHKSDIRQKGIDPNEKWVFHGTQEQFYDEICKNGFKIGGIDIKVNIGKAFGYGVYTATDPTMSIDFYKNKKVILCKGLTGLISTNFLNSEDEFLKNTKYHSYFKDFEKTQSNYYVFFNKEYVLPFFLIEYE